MVLDGSACRGLRLCRSAGGQPERRRRRNARRPSQAAAAGTDNAEAGSAQSTAAGETGGTAASASAGEAYTLPIGDGETDNLTVACLEGWYTAVSINDNLEIWQAIEDRTGVKINWEASADYDTVMQPRIAAGSDLPDIFVVPPSMTNTGVYNLAQEGTDPAAGRSDQRSMRRISRGFWMKTRN